MISPLQVKNVISKGYSSWNVAARVSTGSYTPFRVCYIQLSVDKCGRKEEEVKGSGGEGNTPSQDAERVVGGRREDA